MYIYNQTIAKDLSTLKDSVNTQRNILLSKRLAQNPFVNDLEYLLGAFIEMFEPHLHEIVQQLAKKGYIIDVSSGFSGKFAETQSLNGYVPLTYITRKKLEKIGVKFREIDGLVSLVFWPKAANLDEIKSKFLEIAEILPDKGKLDSPSFYVQAIAFRRQYVPQDKNLQKQRLFDLLLSTIEKQIKTEVKKRKEKKVPPDTVELNLGSFVEELEIQARGAVLLLNKKGYSVDTSGFMDDPSKQMIEGDFQLTQETMDRLRKINVVVETNASGYTRLQFSPVEANIKGIIKQWMQIVSLLPDKKITAAPSMTKKARDFRSHYSR